MEKSTGAGVEAAEGLGEQVGGDVVARRVKPLSNAEDWYEGTRAWSGLYWLFNKHKIYFSTLLRNKSNYVGNVPVTVILSQKKIPNGTLVSL